MNNEPILKINKRATTALIMLVVLYALFSLIPTASHAGSWNGWIYQNPYPTSNTLLAVKFVTPKKGWVAGEQGTILYTEDGGDTWVAQESGTEKEIRSLSFVNEKEGWAVGSSGLIIHTNDGGKAWTPQGRVRPTLNSVLFLSDKEGWVVGNEGTVLHTTDGGKKWEKPDTGIKHNIVSAYFVNPQAGWILAGGEVYRTKDNGKHWVMSSKLPVKMERAGSLTGNGRFMNTMGEEVTEDWSKGEIFFSDDHNGWAVVGKGFLFHSDDGGQTWTDQLMIDPMTYSFSHVYFIDNKRGCATGTGIICTEDGKTWRERLGVKPGGATVIDGFSISPKGISFIGQSVGWVVGDDGMLMKTEDSGKTWKMVAKKNECGRIPFFVNEKTGWLCDDFPTNYHICRTDDGGHTWTKEEIGISEIHTFFVDASSGWAIGQEEADIKRREGEPFSLMATRRFYAPKYMVIKHTTDGGMTWTTQFRELAVKDEHGFAQELMGVDFVDKHTGWIAGGNGLILFTSDGGQHWIRQKTGTKLHLKRIAFVNNQKGIATGDRMMDLGEDDHAKGIILYTDDGGMHWRTVWGKPHVLLIGLFYVDKNTAWVTAETGSGTLLLRSSDGGRSWTEKELKNNYGGSIFFLDKNKGMLIPFPGEMLLVTNDGGINWRKIRKPLHKYPWHFSALFEKTQLEK